MNSLPLRQSRGRTSRLWACVALIGANVIWGTTFVATKPLLDRIPPITIACGRFAIALVILLPLLIWSHQRPILSRTTALMGFVGVLLVYVCQNLGLAYTGAANGALIHGGFPAFTALIATPALGERLGRDRVAGLGLSCMGRHADRAPWFWSRYWRLCYRRRPRVPERYRAGVVPRAWTESVPGGELAGAGRRCATFGFLFLVSASGVELMVRGMTYPSGWDMVALIYLGAAASALAFVLWAYGLRSLEAGQAASFSNLNPFVGVVVAAFVLKEAITAAQVVGGVLILTGVWLTARPAAIPGARKGFPDAVVPGVESVGEPDHALP